MGELAQIHEILEFVKTCEANEHQIWEKHRKTVSFHFLLFSSKVNMTLG